MKKKAKYNISVIGLGYVGLLVALNFSKKYPVVGFDVNETRVKELKKAMDRNQEISPKELKETAINFTADPKELGNANFHIIAVPSLLNFFKQPDLKYLMSASKTLAKYLKKGDVVVYESTAYPGATEESFIPILEENSGLKSGLDFYVGYSPERINPGDKKNHFASIKKIIAGQNKTALDIISDVYQSVLKAEIYKAKGIKIAEAAKLFENVQRDISISIMNEFALICDHLHIDVSAVLDAAKTKWNFIPLEPGLVGGHCIGVNSYYLAYKSMLAGYYPRVIFAGRGVNESMYPFVVQKTIRQLRQLNKKIENCRIGILGISYKENTAYVSDSLVVEMMHLFNSLGSKVFLHDPMLDKAYVKKEYHLTLNTLEELKDLDALIIAVAHDEFKKISPKKIFSMLKPTAMIADLKGILDPEKFKRENIILWRL